MPKGILFLFDFPVPWSTIYRGEFMTSWIKEAVFYHIYPLGFVGAAQYHEETVTHSIKKIADWIYHLPCISGRCLKAMSTVMIQAIIAWSIIAWEPMRISRRFVKHCIRRISALYWMAYSIMLDGTSGPFAMYRKRERHLRIAVGFPICTFMHTAR